MVQFFMFFVIFLSFLISLRLKFLKVDESFLRDKNWWLWSFYELYVLVLQTQTRKMILFFAIFFRFFENFCHILSFLALGVKKPHLGFDKGFDDRLLLGL